MIRRRLVTVLTVSALLVAACSGEEASTTTSVDPTESSTTTAAPTTTTTTAAATTTTTPATTTTEAVPDAGSVFVGAYAFPPGIVDTGYNRQPSRVEGVVGIPEGSGPFPVAVFLHGLAFDCTGLFGLDPDLYVTTEWAPPCTLEGSRYLRNAFAGTAIVEQLAQQGVVALSIDVNAGYFWWGGEARDQDVIDPLIVEHLEILDGIATGTLSLDGYDGSFSIDPASYALIGHSRGGGFVEARLAPSTDDAGYLSPEPQVAVLVGSAGSFGDVELAVPLLNLRASCDADVGSEAGVETASTMAGLGAGIVLDGEVLGSSHWGMTSYSFGVATEGCEETDPEVTETQVAQLVAAFVSGALEDPMELPVDGGVIRLEALAGSLPSTVPPSPATGLEPRDVPITEFDEERLPPISPDDPFTDESQGDDI